MSRSKKRLALCALCEFTVGINGPSCDPNIPGSCSDASFAEAEPSEFHDRPLIQATRKINEILAAIPEDLHGRNLSILGTHRGLLLAWVWHDRATPDDLYASKASKARLARALRLKARK